jgi:oxygen-independent coproporphyrinogen-3 oxidase
MFFVAINLANYEYDVQALVKAFYPEEMVKVITPDTNVEKLRGKYLMGEGLSEREGCSLWKDPSVGETPPGSESESEVCARLWISIYSESACLVMENRIYRWEYDSADNSGKGEYEEGSYKEGSYKEGDYRESDYKEGKYEEGKYEEGDYKYGGCKEGKYKKGNYKEEFIRFLYRVLHRHTGRVLPWGSLTGIRPTKIAYGMLEEGKTEEEIRGYLSTRHYVSEKKAALSIEIAGREREILGQTFCGKEADNGYSLYIGIPFCPTTCMYCSFTSYPIHKYRERVEGYLGCLIREMEYMSSCYRHKALDTVYIGGGTPTTLEAEQLDRMLAHLKCLFDFSVVREFTVEAGRPDSITPKKLQVLKKHGINRISINPQTMNEKTLKRIGRQHTAQQVKDAFNLARESGFDNINMDLILGLPGEGEKEVGDTVAAVTDLGPDSLTVHSLAIKRASALNRRLQGRKDVKEEVSGRNDMKGDNTEQIMEIAANAAAQMGMVPYYLYRQKNMSGNLENVGYAVPGKYGIYNILIMEEKQTIVALGAGSISKLIMPDGRIVRSDNVKDIGLYMNQINEMIARKGRLFSWD